MGFDIRTSLQQKSDTVTYNTQSVQLSAVFDDQMAAYRARRDWQHVLSSYFLLEDKKDFAFTVIQEALPGAALLSCQFTSACGRYAFWRIINGQAPEAERLLVGGKGKVRAEGKLPTSIEDRWIIEEEETASYAEMLKAAFRRLNDLL